MLEQIEQDNKIKQQKQQKELELNLITIEHDKILKKQDENRNINRRL